MTAGAGSRVAQIVGSRAYGCDGHIANDPGNGSNASIAHFSVLRRERRPRSVAHICSKLNIFVTELPDHSPIPCLSIFR